MIQLDELKSSYIEFKKQLSKTKINEHDYKKIIIMFFLIKKLLDDREFFILNVIKKSDDFSYKDDDESVVNFLDIFMKNKPFYSKSLDSHIGKESNLLAFSDIVSFRPRYNEVSLDGINIKTTSQSKYELFRNVFLSFENKRIKELIKNLNFENIFSSLEHKLIDEIFLEGILDVNLSESNVKRETLSDFSTFLINDLIMNDKTCDGKAYTHENLSKLMVDILNPRIKEKGETIIADISSGTGSLLINSFLKLKDDKNIKGLKLISQEKNEMMFALSEFSLVFNGVENYDNNNNDSILDWGKGLQQYSGKFDYFIMDPSFGSSNPYCDDKISGTRKQESRWSLGIPQDSMGDAAFALSGLDLLNDSGKGIVLVSNGFLFNSNKEMLGIRKSLLEKDWIESIIALPKGVHANGNGETCLVVFNKNKDSEYKNKVHMINAREMYTVGKPKNIIDSNNILSILNDKKEIEGISGFVSNSVFIENDHTLTVERYIYTELKTDLMSDKEMMGLQDDIDRLMVDVFKHGRKNRKVILSFVDSLNSGENK